MSQERSALSSAAFQAVVDAAPEGILVLQGQIVFANAKTEQLFAYDPGELLGQPFEALVPELSPDRFSHPASLLPPDLREAPENPALEVRALRKDGTDFQVSISFSPVETDAGQFVCCVLRKADYHAPEATLGLLRICASCKKLRHESGEWQEIESFLRSRAGMTFSHGMCPECSRRWYPDHFRK